MRMGIIVLLVLVATVLAIAALVNKEPVLSTEGYGAIKFGAKLSDVEKSIKSVAAPAAEDERACRYISFPIYPEARFMIEQSVVTRADVSPKAKNELKILIGTPLAKVKVDHPSVVITPHKYDEGGHYLIFRSVDGKSAIVMEESEGEITVIRGGIEPSVEYVEGCL